MPQQKILPLFGLTIGITLSQSVVMRSEQGLVGHPSFLALAKSLEKKVSKKVKDQSLQKLCFKKTCGSKPSDLRTPGRLEMLLQGA